MEMEPSADSIELEPDLAPGMESEEDSAKTRVIKRTAADQERIIPAGWRPTLRNPIPVVRCNYIFHDKHARAGERCNKWSLRGSLLCFTHSGRGNLKHVEEYRQAVIESARLELLDNAPMAVDTLIDLMINSSADAVRLKAAESVLDRNGLKSTDQLDVNLNVTAEDPAIALAQRLDKLRRAAEEVQRRESEQLLALSAASEETADEIVDAEIVEDGG